MMAFDSLNVPLLKRARPFLVSRTDNYKKVQQIILAGVFSFEYGAEILIFGHVKLFNCPKWGQDP